MKRREFIAATAALLVSPRRSWAQGTPRRVGTLGNFKNLPIQKVFDESLRGHGWIEGKNLIIDYRYFEGHAERIPALAAELVALKPDLLIATNTQTAVALKSATANRTSRSPASSSRTRLHAFTHDTSCPSRHRCTSPSARRREWIGPALASTRLQRHYEPLRIPKAPGLSLAGVRLIIPDHALRSPVLRSPCVHAVATTPAQRLDVLLRSFTQPYQPSPKGLSGRPAHRPFRGLLGVHSRCGLHTRAVTVYRDTLTRGFSHFVTSMTAPVASGWSGRRVGLAPTGERGLFTAHTQSGRGIGCG